MSEKKPIPSEPAHPENWPPHPKKKMIMTPLMASVGAMLAFFTVVAMVVVLPTTTFEPPQSDNWRPLTEQELQGRNVFLANGCIYCHSGFTRPQDELASQYYTYPRVSEPGDYTGPGETPNLFGTIRTGPDLSQAGGFHPDDWHYAHYFNARYTTPLSIMPSFKFLSADEAQALIAFTQARGGKAADIRSNHQAALKTLEISSGDVAAQGENGDRSDGYPAASAIKNLAEIDRGYWFADNPLPVTTANLLRGRQVYQERCLGCHGSQGDGNGPAGVYFNPAPAAFDVADDQATGSDTSPGAYYWRILRGLPGTAMENFGTRLSVDDIWKVVLFLKTIPNGGLTVDVPTPDLYIQWQGYPGLFDWANCFYPESLQFPEGLYGHIPSEYGDVPALVNEGEVNPAYAVTLWELNQNARPCGTTGFENVSLMDILNEAKARNDGYARQNVDQTQFIPPDMRHTDQLPPHLLEMVWTAPNPNISSASGNR
ncbi:MAG: cbb3-type cytochrome c oxidase subunit II [Anaerolineales bacterium]|jgi:cytochrome c oxidase cbb3-type subunit 2